MGVIIGDREYSLNIPVTVHHWKNNPKKAPRNTTDVRPRKRFARAVTVHTTKGTADGGIEHVEPDSMNLDLVFAQYQARTERDVSWHFTIDGDGSISQSADPATDECWHANAVNPYTIGVELAELAHGDLGGLQLKSFVALMDLLTGVDHPMMAIQRQTPVRDGKPFSGMLTRLLGENGAGSQVVGIYGHRNVWYRDKDDGKLKPYREKGDPGDAPFLALLENGYEGFDFEANEDLRIWRVRQQPIGVLQADGVPGRETKKALKATGTRFTGLWVPRPGDGT